VCAQGAGVTGGAAQAAPPGCACGTAPASAGAPSPQGADTGRAAPVSAPAVAVRQCTAADIEAAEELAGSRGPRACRAKGAVFQGACVRDGAILASSESSRWSESTAEGTLASLARGA
jgi:hypothetical protein